MCFFSQPGCQVELGTCRIRECVPTQLHRRVLPLNRVAEVAETPQAILYTHTKARKFRLACKYRRVTTKRDFVLFGDRPVFGVRQYYNRT